MNRFEVGASYGVLRMDDRQETVIIASRTESTVTLADGRTCRAAAGMAPCGGSEEVLRLDERGAVATGGVVRVCHRRAIKPAQKASEA